MPVGEMLRRISSRELSEWMAYHQLLADQSASAAPEVETVDDPEVHAARLKAALFKEK